MNKNIETSRTRVTVDIGPWTMLFIAVVLTAYLKALGVISISWNLVLAPAFVVWAIILIIAVLGFINAVARFIKQTFF